MRISSNKNFAIMASGYSQPEYVRLLEHFSHRKAGRISFQNDMSYRNTDSRKGGIVTVKIAADATED